MQTKFVYGGIFLMMLINLSHEACKPGVYDDKGNDKECENLPEVLKKMWLKKRSKINNDNKKVAYYNILPMCLKENTYDIKDLYNPIQIGLQILKRGFCLPFGPPDDIVKTNKKTDIQIRL